MSKYMYLYLVERSICTHTHTHTHTQVHNSIHELLRKMPMVKSVVGKSRAELRGEWHEWKHECKRRRERGDFVAYEQLEILSGVCVYDSRGFLPDLYRGTISQSSSLLSVI